MISNKIRNNNEIYAMISNEIRNNNENYAMMIMRVLCHDALWESEIILQTFKLN